MNRWYHVVPDRRGSALGWAVALDNGERAIYTSEDKTDAVRWAKEKARRNNRPGVEIHRADETVQTQWRNPEYDGPTVKPKSHPWFRGD